MSLKENKLHVGNNDTIDSIKNDLIFYENVKQIPITPYPSYNTDWLCFALKVVQRLKFTHMNIC